MRQNSICITKRKDGSFICVNRGFVFSKNAKEPILCICEDSNKDAIKEVSFFASIEKFLNGRTLDEALKYFEICKTCEKFRTNYCSRDRGCDKHTVFVARLARGFCRDRWNNPAKNSVAHKFFQTKDLVDLTYEIIGVLPPDIDLIIGVARSGLIPATILSTALHLPLMSAGKTRVHSAGSGWRISENTAAPKKILLVEDTVYSGRSLAKIQELVRKTFPNSEIISLAILVHPKSASKVDLYVQALPGRHYLEWNFFNSIAISRCIFDMDGILCEDIPGNLDDDADKYIRALENAVPKYVVRREPIPIIATARLEKYREVTLAWLKKHGISCKRLIMGPWATNEERYAKGEISRFKAGVYSAYSYTLFVESDPIQASEICEITGKEVLCPKLGRVLIK